VSGKILPFPTVDAANLPAALRWYAAAAEDGRLDAASVVLVVHHGEHHLPGLIGLGAPLNRYETAGILAQALLRAQAVAFRGADL
jgi:hypothetical protein